VKSAGTATFPATAFRALVVLPGACVEGALAVLLPWMVAQALLASAWLGAASAGLVAAAMVGTLAAPTLERLLGQRRMTVVTGFVSVVALGAAAMCWVSGLPAAAYGFVLLAIAADAACDLGFISRMPLLARLSAQKLEAFSAANWLWGIGGAAAGSVLAGWAVAADRVVALASGSVLLSLLALVALAVMLPRESRRRAAQPPMLRALLHRRFWTPAAVKVAIVLVALMFFSGPLDNLLLPAHLTSRGLPASTFGDMLAALGLGLAVGLWWMQSGGSARGADLHPASRRDNTRRHKIVMGLLGLAGQLALMLWLPPPWLLLSGLFICATMFAPLLPMLEAAMLTAAHPAQRTLMLSALSKLVGMADVLGTVSMGALMNWSSSTVALGLCLGVACAAALVCGVWPGRPRSNESDQELKK
jgi:MFS family permease